MDTRLPSIARRTSLSSGPGSPRGSSGSGCWRRSRTRAASRCASRPSRASRPRRSPGPPRPRRRRSRMTELRIRTKSKREMIDLTPRVAEIVARAGLAEGLCSVYTPHATAAIVVNENDDPNVCVDVLDCLDRLIPAGVWRHDRVDGVARRERDDLAAAAASGAPLSQAAPDVLGADLQGVADVLEGEQPGAVRGLDPVARLVEELAAAQVACVGILLVAVDGILED